MAGDSHLPREGRMVSDGNAAGDSALGDDQRMGPELHVVADRDQPTQFRAGADHRAAQGGAVDGSVGPDLDVVLEDDVADLGNLVMNASVRRIAVAVGSDGSVGVNDDAVSDDAAVVNNRVGVEDAVAADLGMRADVRAGG